MSNAKLGFTQKADGVRRGNSAHWLVLVIAVLGAGVLYAAFIYDQKRLAIVEDRLQRTVADEDSTFCEKFGMRAGTPQFFACSQELGIIRQKQADRDRAAAQGLL